MLDLLMKAVLGFESYLWVALVILCMVSIYMQNKEMEAHKTAWNNWQAYEPVLGATMWSYVTTPVYKFFRLVAVDIFTTHGVFVIGTFGMMDHFWREMIATNQDMLSYMFILLNGIAWVNFAFPKYRPQFFRVVIGCFQALANKLTPGTFPPMPPEKE